MMEIGLVMLITGTACLLFAIETRKLHQLNDGGAVVLGALTMTIMMGLMGLILYNVGKLKKYSEKIAVGRKNWMFSNSVDGANASAVVYTMVEMAKAHGLNIYGYLKFLLEHRPSKDMTDEQLEELAPWSEKLQSIKNRM